MIIKYFQGNGAILPPSHVHSFQYYITSHFFAIASSWLLFGLDIQHLINYTGQVMQHFFWIKVDLDTRFRPGSIGDYIEICRQHVPICCETTKPTG